MFESLRRRWQKWRGTWWEDYNVHVTGGQRRVVAICNQCESPRMKRGGSENPYYRCPECSPHAHQSTWRTDTYEVDEYEATFLD